MKALRRLRPSPSMAIACVALFVALGGVGYAAATINGKSIKNGTVTPAKIKSRSLSGTQVRANGIGGPSIKESTLGTVPSATKANTATSATNATTATNATQLGGAAASSYQRFGQPQSAGTTVTGAFNCFAQGATICKSVVGLPATAPASLSNPTVNFAASVGNFVALDADGTCSGNANSPTAPPGKVCLYFANNGASSGAVEGEGNVINGTNATRGFEVALNTAPAGTIDIEGIWAYTAP